jgi:hypothetical protein
MMWLLVAKHPYRMRGIVGGLTRFRRTSDGDVIPGPEQGFDIVGGYFSADLKGLQWLF